MKKERMIRLNRRFDATEENRRENNRTFALNMDQLDNVSGGAFDAQAILARDPEDDFHH